MKSKLPDIGTTIFTKMSALANEYGAINLSQGFPNFPIDPKLKKLVEKALTNEQVQYAPLAGRPDLLAALGDKLTQQHAISINPTEEITITAGATQAIYSAISAIVDEGDEVILFDPAYDCYNPTIRYNKGIPIHLKLTHPNYKINWKEVENSVSHRTKLIIVNNPHNPCGSVWDSSDLDALEKIIVAHPHILILSDEVYEHIQFEGNHQSVLSRPQLREKSFAIYSFGKTFHVTGWKIGYCVAPKDLTIEMRKHHQFNVFCVNNTIQCALAEYIKSYEAWSEIAVQYQRRKNLFLRSIENSRFKILPCEGTYFCLLDYSAISDLDDVTFTEQLVKENGIALIPVSVFYNDNTDRKVVRVCFAKDDKMLLEGAKKLCSI